jgi:hypothetical protein
MAKASTPLVSTESKWGKRRLAATVLGCTAALLVLVLVALVASTTDIVGGPSELIVQGHGKADEGRAAARAADPSNVAHATRAALALKVAEKSFPSANGIALKQAEKAFPQQSVSHEAGRRVFYAPNHINEAKAPPSEVDVNCMIAAMRSTKKIRENSLRRARRLTNLFEACKRGAAGAGAGVRQDDELTQAKRDNKRVRREVEEIVGDKEAAHITNLMWPGETGSPSDDDILTEAEKEALIEAIRKHGGQFAVQEPKDLVSGAFRYAANGIYQLLGVDRDDLPLLNIDSMKKEILALNEPEATELINYILYEPASEKPYRNGKSSLYSFQVKISNT